MVTTREIRGSKAQILEQIQRVDGQILSALVLVEEPASQKPGPVTDAELNQFMAEMEADTVSVDHVDDSREAMYTRMPGE